MESAPEEKNDQQYGWARFWPGWLAVGGVWALSMARPMYANIAIGPEALTDLEIRRLDLVVLIILISLVVPTVLVLTGMLVNRLLGAKVRAWYIAACVSVISSLFAWQQVTESATILRLVLPVVVAVGFFILLLRSRFIQNFVLILGAAIPVVIIAFMVSFPVWQTIQPFTSAPKVAAIKSHTPVVMVIFDELPLAGLENSNGQIDSKDFPNFAKLAKKANWYPQMTASGTETTYAVPGIMSGQQPTAGPTADPSPPGLPQHPDNVCSEAAAGGYKVYDYQAITDLCHRELGMGSRVSYALRRSVGAVPETGGADLVPGRFDKKLTDRIGSHFPQPPDLELGRQTAVTNFINGMSGDDRTLSLMHVTLPHVPWMFMPDGTYYISNRFTSDNVTLSPNSKAQVTHDMQQFELQLMYTDHELGRVIRRMKQLGTWNKALFVVTADHGGSFIPKDFRRVPGLTNSGWILPIPLFIKYPGQTSGQVVHGSATSLDIAPTVYDTLGIKKPSVAQGVSLAGKKSLPVPKLIQTHGAFGPSRANFKFVQELLAQARKQRNATFAGGELFALAGHRELLGKYPGTVKGLLPLDSVSEEAAELADVDTSTPDRPSFFKAAITTPGIRARTPVAVALNGKIVATTTTWNEGTGVVAGVNMPDQDFVDGANTVKLYEIPTGKPAKKPAVDTAPKP